jgi:hypothetical protein
MQKGVILGCGNRSNAGMDTWIQLPYAKLYPFPGLLFRTLAARLLVVPHSLGWSLLTTTLQLRQGSFTPSSPAPPPEPLNANSHLTGNVTLHSAQSLPASVSYPACTTEPAFQRRHSSFNLGPGGLFSTTTLSIQGRL